MRVLHLTPEFPPVIWGGLGTAVGGLVTAEAHSGMTVGVLLVGTSVAASIALTRRHSVANRKKRQPIIQRG